MPSNSRQRNDIIYKGAEQLFALYYSLLTFFAFDYLVSLKFTNCFHTSLIGSLRKRIKPDTPLIFNWELFWENTNGFYEKIPPLIGSQWTGSIYKVATQLWDSTIRCLLFWDLSNIFLLDLQIVFISPHYSLLTFSLKNNPKIENL